MKGQRPLFVGRQEINDFPRVSIACPSGYVIPIKEAHVGAWVSVERGLHQLQQLQHY